MARGLSSGKHGEMMVTGCKLSVIPWVSSENLMHSTVTPLKIC